MRPGHRDAAFFDHRTASSREHRMLGTVIGDINSRRGQIQAQEERHGDMVINALVPLSEMFGYVGDLRSKTSGQASYSMEFDSYAEVPTNIADEIIKKVRGE